MSAHCHDDHCHSSPASADPRYRRILWVALIVNAAMVRNVPRYEAEARARRMFAPLLAPLGRDFEPADFFYYRADGGKNDMLNVRAQVGFE